MHVVCHMAFQFTWNMLKDVTLDELYISQPSLLWSKFIRNIYDLSLPLHLTPELSFTLLILALPLHWISALPTYISFTLTPDLSFTLLILALPLHWISALPYLY